MITAFDQRQVTGMMLALALGLLVGIQRQWSQRKLPGGTRFAGVRTFGLLGLAGGIAGLLYQSAAGPAVVLLGAAAALVVIGYRRSSTDAKHISGTASVVGLITLAGGFLAGWGERLIATAIVVAMVLLLAMRSSLHRWIDRLNEREVLAIARFAVIAMVILPLLPDRGMGPYNAWNPRQLWLVVVLVSGFSFAGYFATKLLGAAKGILATACAGSMVSSTAVTASLATKIKQGGQDTALFASAVSAASVVMFVRVLLLVGLLAPFALGEFALRVVPGLLVSLGFAAWYWRNAGTPARAEARHEVGLRNPFDLGPAILLALLVMVFTVAAHFTLARFGDRGLAAVLALSGTIDVDSAIITLGSLPGGTIDARTAGLVLAIPVTLNTVFKASIATSLGGWQQGKHGTLPLIAAALTVAGACALLR